MRAAQRNATIGCVAFDLVLKLQGLRTKALSEQRDHIALAAVAFERRDLR